MKRYRFALETVLRLRRVEEDSAKLALADAMRKVAAANAVLNERLDHYYDLPPRSEAPRVDVFMLELRRRELAAAAVVSAGAEHLMAEAIADERRSFLNAARTRTAVLERLDERRRAEHAVEVDRDEVKEVDDIVTGRYGRTPMGVNR